MQPASDQPLVLVLRSIGGIGTKSGVDATNCRAIYEDSGIWSAADGPPFTAAGILGKQEAGKAIDAEDGADGDVSETQHEQTAS